MIAPNYPDYVDAGLKSIEESFHLRWNPTAYVIKYGSYNADGTPVPPVYEPRWELWGKDVNGVDYKVMTVDVRGEFRAPGQWLIDHLHKLNPANFDGDISRMLRAVVDDENNALQSVQEKDWQDFIQGVTNWYWNSGKPMVMKAKDGF